MKRILALCVSAIAWFALIVQMYISIQLNLARGGSVAYGVWMYFAFFTVTTNLLVALTLTVPALAPSSRLGRFLAKPSSITGATASIIIVALVYVTLLMHLNRQVGWRLVTDLLLHFVVPALTVAYWWVAVQRGTVAWKPAAMWGMYPVAYFFYAMARGVASDFYPYYFLNAAQLGYGAVLLNAIGVLSLFFFILSVLLALKSSRVSAGSAETAA
jgi:hypothetical protein